MTREEQRVLREVKKPVDKTCKEIGKRRGWKTFGGEQYQVRGDILYILYISAGQGKKGLCLLVYLRCKSFAVDDLFWKLTGQQDIMAKKPFSFHINGSPATWPLTLEQWSRPLSPESVESCVDGAFQEVETFLSEKWTLSTLADLRGAIAELGSQGINQDTNAILCLICEGNYKQALEKIESALAQGSNGGFVSVSRGKNILEDARDYCAARLEARP